MSVIDWESKPEPWRTIGLGFVADCERIIYAPPPVPPPPKPKPPRREDIIKRRHALGMSQTAIGKLIGTTQNRISEMELGKRDPRLYCDLLDRLERERRS